MYTYVSIGCTDHREYIYQKKVSADKCSSAISDGLVVEFAVNLVCLAQQQESKYR